MNYAYHNGATAEMIAVLIMDDQINFRAFADLILARAIKQTNQTLLVILIKRCKGFGLNHMAKEALYTIYHSYLIVALSDRSSEMDGPKRGGP